MAESLLLPERVLPQGVFACVTTRQGGCSQPPWDSFNLGLHVDDAPARVAANRERLQQLLQQHTGLSQVPVQWLRQVHGCAVHVQESSQPLPTPPEADALYTRAAGIACAVLTADCLPVLFAARDGSEVAVAHAGWRGLAGGVLEATLAKFKAAPGQVAAWLGPAIGPCHFEVGAEVREQFLAAAPLALRVATDAAFVPGAPGKYQADLYTLARLRLQVAGLRDIAGQPRCTVCDADRWFSYRREPRTGRFATLILRLP